MAAIAQPTWAEVNDMPLVMVEAMNIIKGEANGDKFLWDQKWTDPKTGEPIEGVWRSTVEAAKQKSRPSGGRKGR